MINPRYFWFLFAVFTALIIVRPAHASGTVPVGDCFDGNYQVANSYHTTHNVQGEAACLSVLRSHPASSTLTWVQQSGGSFKTGGSTSYDANASGTWYYSLGALIYTGTFSCVSPQVPSSDGASCVAPACPATGTSYSSGFYDVGTIDNGGAPPITSCASGCQVQYGGANAQYRSLQGGIYHYYAQGSYTYSSGINGGVCTSGSAPTISSSTVPSQNCAAGQSYVSDSSGHLKCLYSDTGASTDPNSASAVAATKAANDAAAAAAGAAASAAATKAAYDNAISNGYSAASAVIISQAAGAAASGQQAGAAAAALANPVDPCKDSTSVGCMQAGNEVVPDDVPLGTKTINVSSIVPLSVGGAGVCPAPAAMTIHGHTEYFSYTTYCNFSTGIKPIILAFAWLLAAGILIGSIKT